MGGQAPLWSKLQVLSVDIAIMKEMGLQAYRFSIAWPRVDPKGDGHWNQAGLHYYSELVDGLLEEGIQPGPGPGCGRRSWAPEEGQRSPAGLPPRLREPDWRDNRPSGARGF